MEFKTLLEPYADPDETGKPRRTIEGQIAWLNKRHGIPISVVDQAILKVYNELDAGKKFEDDESGTAGHQLDHYLLKTAKEIEKEGQSKQARELEAFLSTFKRSAVEEYVKAQRGSVWKRVKAVFKPV